MALDPNISLQVTPQPIANAFAQPSPLDTLGKALSLKNALTQGQLGNLQLKSGQMQYDQTQALNAALRDPNYNSLDPNAQRASLLQAGGSSAIPLITSQMNLGKIQAETAAANAQAGKANIETEALNLQDAGNRAAQVKDQTGLNEFIAMAPKWGRDPSSIPSTWGPEAQAWMEKQSNMATTAAQRLDAQMKQQQMAETARNNAATITKDYAVAGIDQNGSPSPQKQAVIDAVAKGTIVPDRATISPAGVNILGSALMQNQGLTSGDAPALKKALIEFGPAGESGKSVMALNKVAMHIDTLTQAANALKNGNTPLANKYLNMLGAATGNPQLADFQAAQQVVGDEFSKALGGAAAGDREKAQGLFHPNMSPAQFLGVRGTVGELLGGQFDALQKAYTSSTGRNDFGTKLLPEAQALLANHLSARTPANAPTPLGFPSVSPVQQLSRDSDRVRILQDELNAPGISASDKAAIQAEISKTQGASAAGLPFRTTMAGGQAAPVAKPTPPLTNAQGWQLHKDRTGAFAYVSPDGKQFQELR